MRHALLRMVPLVLLAACHDASPLQPALEPRTSVARAGGAVSALAVQCPQPMRLAGTVVSTSGDPHRLVRVTVIEDMDHFSFSVPASLVPGYEPGMGANCQMWGRTAGGRGTITVAEDTTRDTLDLVQPPPVEVQQYYRIKFGRRSLSHLWILVKEHKARCVSCIGSDTTIYRYDEGFVFRDSVARVLGGFGARFGWGDVGTDRDDIPSAFVAGCVAANLMRESFGFNEDRDRRWVEELGGHLMNDNHVDLEASSAWMTNWRAGIVSGLRSWSPTCVDDMLATWRLDQLKLGPNVRTHSPGTGGGGGGGGGGGNYLPRDPFDPGFPPEYHPTRDLRVPPSLTAP